MRLAAVEQPVLATDDDLAERALAPGVVEWEATVEEDALEFGSLVVRVAQRLRRERTARLELPRSLHPDEEVFDEGRHARTAPRAEFSVMLPLAKTPPATEKAVV